MGTTTEDAGVEGLVEQTRSELGDAASTVQEKAVELEEHGRSKLSETLEPARGGSRRAGVRSHAQYVRAVRS